MSDIEAIRCDHDGLKMAEVQDGHLILRKKHHGQTHVKIVSLAAFGLTPAGARSADESEDPSPPPARSQGTPCS